MLVFALSLTHSVCDCPHHDVCLPSLYHSLAIALVIMLALALSLTLLVLALSHHYVFPRPLTHPLTHSLTHSVVLALTSMFALTLSPIHSVCNCAYGRSHLLAITHTIMFALALSLTHSMHTYDYTHHPVCLPSTSHSHTLLVITSSYIHHHTCVHHQE